MSCTSPSDVARAFEDIRPKVRSSPFFGSTRRYMAARNAHVPWPDYTSNPANSYGLGEHFQGVTRVGNRLVIAGGIKDGHHGSQLIVMEMGTRKSTAQQPWTHPAWAPPSFRYPSGYSYKNPPAEDVSIRVFNLDPRGNRPSGPNSKWHAGGIQAVDTVVAVPIYGSNNSSEVRFVDLPENQAYREILSLPKAGTQSKSVGLAKIPPLQYGGSGYLLVVWDDELLDFHFSKSDRLSDGFEPEARMRKDELPLPVSKSGLVTRGFRAGSDFMSGTYQSVNLVTERSGKVFLVATRNSQKASPTITGRDVVDLYRLGWPGRDFTRKPRVEPVDSKQMYCYNGQCNFGAAAGIHVDSDAELLLYAAAHWLHGGNARFNFNEYSAYR